MNGQLLFSYIVQNSTTGAYEDNRRVSRTS